MMMLAVVANEMEKRRVCASGKRGGTCSALSMQVDKQTYEHYVFQSSRECHHCLSLSPFR